MCPGESGASGALMLGVISWKHTDDSVDVELGNGRIVLGLPAEAIRLVRKKEPQEKAIPLAVGDRVEAR